MAENQVGIALHKHFYIKFFENYKDLINILTTINYSNSTKSLSLYGGIKKLKIIYSTYSHYLKENNDDDYLKRIIEDLHKEIKSDKVYNELLKKADNGIGSFEYNELTQLNLLHHKHLNNLLDVFGNFCSSFAQSDLFPRLTDNVREHEKAVVYAVYDVFYESFYNIHSKVQSSLNDFNITTFNEVYKYLLVFFRGYNYYLQKDTIKNVVECLDELYTYYNNEEFLRAYYNLLQDNINMASIKVIKSYTEILLDKCIYINELINNDLPKTNLFPKMTEIILFDTTLI